MYFYIVVVSLRLCIAREKREIDVTICSVLSIYRDFLALHRKRHLCLQLGENPSRRVHALMTVLAPTEQRSAMKLIDRQRGKVFVMPSAGLAN